MEYPACTKEIIDLLENEGVAHELLEHAPVVTSEDAADVREGLSLSAGVKALIVKLYKDEGDVFVMLAVPGDTKFDKQRVLQKAEAGRLRFAREEEIDDITDGVPIGGIPPFGSLFGLDMYVDPDVFENENVVFNAGSREVSIVLAPEDYRNMIHAQVSDIT